jgi:cytochrome c-type biogenesis protein CcmH/NrfG
MIEQMLAAERALLHGRLDEAERIYRLTIQHDPGNSIAMVGLARVALERADDRGALDLARQALVLDPENVAARRLAERMAEVLRYRGEEVARGPEQGRQAGVPAEEPPEEAPVRGRALLDRFRRRG